MVRGVGITLGVGSERWTGGLGWAGGGSRRRGRARGWVASGGSVSSHPHGAFLGSEDGIGLRPKAGAAAHGALLVAGRLGPGRARPGKRGPARGLRGCGRRCAERRGRVASLRRHVGEGAGRWRRRSRGYCCRRRAWRRPRAPHGHDDWLGHSAARPWRAGARDPGTGRGRACPKRAGSRPRRGRRASAGNPAIRAHGSHLHCRVPGARLHAPSRQRHLPTRRRSERAVRPRALHPRPQRGPRAGLGLHLHRGVAMLV